MNKKWELFMSLLLILTVSFIARNIGTIESMAETADRIVVLDAGHGGARGPGGNT